MTRQRAAMMIRALVATVLTAAVLALAVQTGPRAEAQSGLVSINGPYRAAAGQSILMSGTFNTTVAGVVPFQWIWSFGDGTTATGQTVQKIYNVAGTYIVTLQVQTAQGTALASTTATITGGAAGGLISAGGPYTGVVGQPILMTGVSMIFNVAPTGWVWSFGDGTTASGQSVQKTYSSPGTFTVTVNAITPEGSVSATTTATITGPSMVPGATVQLVSGCTNVVSTWPDGTAPATIVAAVNPPSAVTSVWRNQAGGLSFLAYAPTTPAATNNLLMVGRFEAIFICTTTGATLTRPVA